MEKLLVLVILGVGLFVGIQATPDLPSVDGDGDGDGDDDAQPQPESLVAQVDAIRQVASHTRNNILAVPNWLTARCHCRNADGDESVSCALINDGFEFAQWNKSDDATALALEQAGAWFQELMLQFGVGDAVASDDDARVALLFMTSVGRVAAEQCEKSGSDDASVSLQAVVYRNDQDGWTLDLKTGIYLVEPAAIKGSRRLSRNRRSTDFNPYVNQDGVGGRLSYENGRWTTTGDVHYNPYANRWGYNVGAEYQINNNGRAYGSYSNNGNWEVGLRFRW